MSLKNWSVVAASNNSSPPNGAPEGMTLANVNNVIRQNMADTRTLAAADTIAAAATTDIGSKDATFLTLTGGATTINALGTVSAGIYKFVIFNAAHTLTYNATSLILIGNASRTVTAGDVGLFLSEGSGNWRELSFAPDAGYQPLDATLTALAGVLTAANKIPYATALNTASELTLSTNTALGTSDTTLSSQNAVKTYADTKDIATQVAPSTSGNVLTSNGSAWVSSAPVGITKYTSADTALTAASTTSFTHSLGSAPLMVNVFLICQTGEAGYSAGDVVLWAADGDAVSRGLSLTCTATQIIARVGSNANAANLQNKTTGSSANLTNANWKYRVTAMA